MERKLFHLSVALIIIKDHKVLLMKRCNTGYMDGMYSLVGGHVEDNESFKTAVIRETKEELGIDICEADLKFVCIIRKTIEDDYVNTFFVTDKYIGNPTNIEEDKCDDLKWFDVDSLPNNIIPADKRAIENYFNKIYFDEFR